MASLLQKIYMTLFKSELLLGPHLTVKLNPQLIFFHHKKYLKT